MVQSDLYYTRLYYTRTSIIRGFGAKIWYAQLFQAKQHVRPPGAGHRLATAIACPYHRIRTISSNLTSQVTKLNDVSALHAKILVCPVVVSRPDAVCTGTCKILHFGAKNE